MTGLAFTLAGAQLVGRGSGALHWPDQGLLCVSDLHLGKSQRAARRGGAALPPYELHETLARLDADLAATAPGLVICLGDTFDAPDDDLRLPDAVRLWLSRMQAGRRWIWLAGNHDPGPTTLGGSHLDHVTLGPLVFRHIASPAAVKAADWPDGVGAEVSGHYHPKVRLALRGGSVSRPAFLVDDRRLILPAYGTYTGGLRSTDPALARLMGSDARAILTGDRPLVLPMPR